MKEFNRLQELIELISSTDFSSWQSDVYYHELMSIIDIIDSKIAQQLHTLHG